MKIVELKTTLFEFELDRVMGDANSPRGRTKSGSCLVELITDEGLVGISIGGGNSIAQIKSLFEGILVGSDPKAVYSIWIVYPSGSSSCDVEKSSAHQAASFGIVSGIC